MHCNVTMILDGHRYLVNYHCDCADVTTSLLNLEVLENTTTHTDKGTLLGVLSHCTSAFGKRLFRRWVCNPLRHYAAIEARLDGNFISVMLYFLTYSQLLKNWMSHT